MSKLFSIVSAVYNVEDYLEEAIDSVINQTIGFEENVQLILVNDGSTDNSEKICLKYEKSFPDNIIVISKENGGQATARNKGLEYADGKYVNFLDPDDKLSLNCLYEVNRFFNKFKDEVDLISIPMFFFEDKEGDHILNYKFEKSKVVDIYVDYNFIQLSGASGFIKRSAIGKRRFKELVASEDTLFVNEIILDKCKYGVINTCQYYYRKRITSTSTLQNITNNKRYYNERIEKYMFSLIDYSISKFGTTPQYIQFVIMYTLQWMLKLNRVEKVLSTKEFSLLKENIFNILQYIDDEVIINQRNIIPSLKSHILRIKYSEDKPKLLFSRAKDSNAYLSRGNAIVDDFENHIIRFDSFSISDNILTFNGFFNSLFDNKDIVVEAIRNGKSFKAEKIDYPQRNKKSFNILINDIYNFKIDIPLENKDNTIYFNVRYRNVNKDRTYSHEIRFRNRSGLSKISNYSTKGNYTILLKDNGDSSEIQVKPRSKLNSIKLELFVWKNILKNFSNSKAIFVRLFSFLIGLFFTNPVWLFMDRIDKADDNAEHLFKYASKQKDNINKYFVIRKDSVDFERISKVGKVLSYGSYKHKIMVLVAEKFISSHSDIKYMNPFGKTIVLYEGLIHFDFVYLKHGIIKDDLSKLLGKYFKNIKLFITTAFPEYDSIINGKYGYGEDNVKLLGMPRFDGLNDKNMKKVTIMPTWRGSNLLDEDVLLKSDFFNRYKKIVNDEKLLNYLSENGYELEFRPHPRLYEIIHIFEENKPKNVTIPKFEASYQKTFNESKLLITDYSSVAFDFAYLRKPILYYQWEGDDYHLEKGYFDYEKCGFGEIISSHDELVDSIINYIENDCKIKDKYDERINNFYAFVDRENCKRVYDSIMMMGNK
ncbi:MAG: CDP-glycerol:glycerophosphate glycerophosphotransferase [Methanobacteriaceae archaeon]